MRDAPIARLGARLTFVARSLEAQSDCPSSHLASSLIDLNWQRMWDAGLEVRLFSFTRLIEMWR